MNTERRKFLQHLAALCGAGVARTLGVGLGAGTIAVATTTAAAGATAVAGAYGAGVRGQVFEVIVRQGLAGAPWKEICKGPMSVNGITEDEINAEIKRRRSIPHTKLPHCTCATCGALIATRHRRLQTQLDAIPHTPVSPCACKDCRMAINKLMSVMRSTVFTDEESG